MLHYICGMCMPLPPPHYEQPRGEAEVRADIDLYHPSSYFPFPTFFERLRTTFGSSVGEELYYFPFIVF